jgi:hypothetical protein
VVKKDLFNREVVRREHQSRVINVSVNAWFKARQFSRKEAQESQKKEAETEFLTAISRCVSFGS